MVGSARFHKHVSPIEFKPGGLWKYTTHRPDGRDFANESRFVEIVVPERIVLEHIVAPRFRLTVLFEELGERTKLTFRQLFETLASYDQVKKFAVQGNEDNLDRLASLLAARLARQSGER